MNPDHDGVRDSLTKTQKKWWERQGVSPTVSCEDFGAGCGRVPDVKGEFGYFPTSVLVLGRPKPLFDMLADSDRPIRNTSSAYHPVKKASTFPPAASWFCVKFWSRPGDLVLDTFGNRANIGLVANWLGRHVVVNDIVPRYCQMMEAAGARRPNPDCSWTVLNQDAADLAGVAPESVHLVLTGPPYHNLERYEQAPGQASGFRTYRQFLAWYRRVAKEMMRVARPGGFCVYKVANWRKAGRFVPFVSDTLAAFEAAGWVWHDELVCAEPAPMGNGFGWANKWRKRYVSKAHQTILVFRRP